MLVPYVAVATISFFAGLVQGLTGFGSALLAMPLFLLFLDAKTAVPLSILNGLIITSYLCLQLKRHLDWGKIFPLLLGCLPGIVVGVYFLKRAGNTWIKVLLGILLIGYALFSLRFKPKAIKMPSFGPYVAGFATGAIGAAFSAGGPPVIIYTMLTGWPKDTIKATLSGLFFLTGLLIACAHWLSGLTNALVLQYFSVSAPPIIIGVWLGSRIYSRTSMDAYIRIILLLLIGMGILMVASALNLHI
ncbi:MAG: TSUP family transporter [Nitrospiraceae bacterium]|nr:TSUP family transporter [Nitrospiraceae bacterium]